METRDMAEVVETFRTKFMEGAAGIADRVAGVCAGLVAPPGGMAPNGMELELQELVSGDLNCLPPQQSRTRPRLSTPCSWLSHHHLGTIGST